MPAATSAVELSADCEACGLEAGVVEIYDVLVPACRFGIPASSRCKLCALAYRGELDVAPAKAMTEIPANRCPACLHELTPTAIDDRCCASCGATALMTETASAKTFASINELEGALDAWAALEKFPSRQALVNATFAEQDIALLFAQLQKKEPLEILADPFANMGVKTTGGRSKSSKDGSKKAQNAGKNALPNAAKAPANVEPAPFLGEVARAPAPRPEEAKQNATVRMPPIVMRAVAAAPPPPPPPAPSELPPRSAPPRAILYPIVSVIAADGEIHPDERALIDRFLKSEGLSPLAEEEYCVHHPSAVAHFVPKERREDVVKLMCETAAVDGMPDESERRVIRAYATAWDVDDEKLEFWMWGYESMNTSLTRGLWLKIRRFVLSARWSEEAVERRAGKIEGAD